MNPPVRRINYSYAMNQVEKIRDLSRDTSKIADELDNVISQTSKVWSGNASKSFTEQCSFIKEDIKSTAKDISTLADRVSSAAKSINSEDNDAIDRYNEWVRQQSLINQN